MCVFIILFVGVFQIGADFRVSLPGSASVVFSSRPVSKIVHWDETQDLRGPFPLSNNDLNSDAVLESHGRENHQFRDIAAIVSVFVRQEWRLPNNFRVDETDSKLRIGDQLIGSAVVDISSLSVGMPEICGWYHIVDNFQQSQGLLKLTVTPRVPVPLRAPIIFSDTSTPLVSHLNNDLDLPCLESERMSEFEDSEDDEGSQQEIYLTENEISPRLVSNGDSHDSIVVVDDDDDDDDEENVDFVDRDWNQFPFSIQKEVDVPLVLEVSDSHLAEDENVNVNEEERGIEPHHWPL